MVNLWISFIQILARLPTKSYTRDWWRRWRLLEHWKHPKLDYQLDYQLGGKSSSKNCIKWNTLRLVKSYQRCAPGLGMGKTCFFNTHFEKFSERFLESWNAYKTFFLISNRLTGKKPFSIFFYSFWNDFFVLKYQNEFKFQKDFLPVFKVQKNFPFQFQIEISKRILVSKLCFTSFKVQNNFSIFKLKPIFPFSISNRFFRFQFQTDFSVFNFKMIFLLSNL